MPCKVNGCSQSKHHYNPAISSLNKYNHHLANSFSALPEKGKAAECAKRIVLILAIPFAYLALSLSSMIGLTFDSALKKKHEEEILSLKPKACDYPHKNADELKEIWKKRQCLFAMVKKMKAPLKAWKKRVISKILANPKILDDLKVKLPLSQIEEIFKKYGIIVLRKPKNEDLLFYCGNDPIYSSAMDKDYSQDPTHTHSGHDTLDCDLLMNPTIVAPFGKKGIHDYLKSISHKYKRISGCVMSVMNSSKALKRQMRFLDNLAEGETAIEHAYSSKDLSEVKKIEKLAKQHHFETSIQQKDNLFVLLLRK